MEIVVVSTIEHYASIRSDWETAYKQDTGATIHRSWAWLRGWLEGTPHDWFILAARENATAPFVAFFPLCKRKRKNGIIDLFMGGHPLSAHTGMVSIPEYESMAVKLFAQFLLKQQGWERFLIKDVFDPRIEDFVNCFRSSSVQIETKQPTICPYMKLSDNWDHYVATAFGKKSRHHMRKLFNQIDELKDFRAISIGDVELEPMIDRTLELWQKTWGVKQESELDEYRCLFRFAHKFGILRLVEYCDGEERFAIVVTWLDREKKIFSPFIWVSNKEFEGLESPGKAANFLELQYAVNNGYEICDLGRGVEHYKYRLGAIDRFNANYVISRKRPLKKVYNKLKKLKKLVGAS